LAQPPFKRDTSFRSEGKVDAPSSGGVFSPGEHRNLFGGILRLRGATSLDAIGIHKDDVTVKRPPRIAVQMELYWQYERHRETYAAIQDYADERGWDLVIDDFVARHGDSAERDDFPYDAVIGRIEPRLAELTSRWRIPTVNVWYSSPARQSVASVCVDPTALGHMVAEHLLQRGHRRFAVLGRQDVHNTNAAQAFDDAVRRAGCECLVEAVHHDFDESVDRYPTAMRTIAAWIDAWRPPVGVFTLGHALGRIVVQICRRQGVRVPQDAAIVCGIDEESHCLRPRPMLSSVTSGHKEIGHAAAQCLDEMLHHSPRSHTPAQPPPQILIPPLGIVTRESTDFFATHDQVVAEAVAFIKSNAHRDISPTDVARAVATSVRMLQMRFRRVVDRSIVATIRLARIEKAKRELVDGERKLTAIARDAGFGTTTRMAYAFQSELGMTPNAYRRQWRRLGQPDSLP